MRPLRPHQERAIAELRKSLGLGFKRPMLQAPTGFGKTLTAAHIIDSALSKGKRVLFTVPAISLIDQTVEEFWKEGIRDVGVMQANHPMTAPELPVQVASVQTLQRRQKPDVDLVIVDEAHRVFDFFSDWFEEWTDIPFIGLSATPWTKGLGRLYDKLIIAATTAELIENGFLAPFRVFSPSRPDMSNVRTVAGDWHEGDLSDAMAPITGDIVSTWLALGENLPTLCFAVDRAHAKLLQEQFEAAGVPSAYVDANTDRDERKRLLGKLNSGEIKVICNIGTMTTGVDADVRCIILARPTKSEMLFTQIIGRALRTAPGKESALILDHTDTTLRLGFVTDIQHERLCDGSVNKSQTREAGILPKECPKCHRLKAKGQHKCPSCGHEPEQRDQRAGGVEWQDGELVELEVRAANKANRDDAWSEKISFIAQLKAYAISTGKQPGWVAHKYKSKYNCWPNDPRVKNARPAADVSPEVRSWIKAQNIRFAKRRAA